MKFLALTVTFTFVGALAHVQAQTQTVAQFVDAAATKPIASPELQKAQEIQAQIAAYEAAVNQHVEQINAAIDQAIGNYRPEDWESEQVAVESFRPLVQLLNQWANSLLTHRAGYAESLGDLGEAVTSSADTFRSAGALFRKYAEEERFAEIKEDYLLVADSWEKLAVVMEERGPVIVQEQGDIKDFFDYVASSAEFLVRLDEHLAVYPADGAIRNRQSHLGQVRRYVEGFEKLRKHLREFNAKLSAVQEKATPAKAAHPEQIVLASSASSPSAGKQPSIQEKPRKSRVMYGAVGLAGFCLVAFARARRRRRRTAQEPRKGAKK